MEGQLLFLGTGASTGIPLIGCHCEVCSSHDPLNHRLRPSALITIEGKKILIDAGPDFRAQAITYKIDALDGVLFTHTHYDHIAGLDELRIYYIRSKQNLPVLLSESSLTEIKRRYYYLFEQKSDEKSLSAQLDFTTLKGKRGKVSFLGIPFSYMSYSQGGMEVTGFRWGDLAYVTDIYSYEETIFEDLKGVKTLIVSAVANRPSPVHFSIEQAVEFAQKVGAEKTWFVHMCHLLDHEKTNELLPSGIALAYDGLTVEFKIR